MDVTRRIMKRREDVWWVVAGEESLGEFRERCEEWERKGGET